MSEGEPLIDVLQRLIESSKCADVCKTEREALAKFCQLYQGQRSFTQCSYSQLFQQLLYLLRQRCLTKDWLVGGATTQEHLSHAHAALMALRLLLRDEQLQHVFMENEAPLPPLKEFLAQLVGEHFSLSRMERGRDILVTADLLKEMTNIFQKLSNCEEHRQALVDTGVHSFLIQLLWSHDLVPLQCSICALINLCKTESVSACVASLNCAPPLLHIISSYDTVSRHLASDLLLLLSQQSKLQDQIRVSDCLSQCLRILHSQDPHLLHRMVGVVERLLECSDYQESVRLLGGIPLLLGLLSKHVIGDAQSLTTQEKLLALRAVCCSALTQLVLNDANAQLIVQGNGVFLIATNIVPLVLSSKQLDRVQQTLQRYALRALRYLFSMERNRRVFKKLFPPSLFEMFINIGHYVRDLSAYSQLMHTINTLPESERAVIQANIEAANHNRAPIFSIAGYAVLELLGSGAFGSVYKVCKQSSQLHFALKEIRCSHPALGHTDTERSTSIGRLLNEVNMIHEDLRHPNVVRYHKCFQEEDHLYIVMELLEGAPLSDYISSLTERGAKFSEDRLWKIFLQLLLALRYLHKEKRIVHRDLSPANLMISDEDKLTITDFGLAKQKQRDLSVMKSVVGTVLYWCPELVQSEPYNEKSDVWAAGCILYLMATLKPPFYSTNLLALAKKIAEVDYVAISEESYSPLVNQVVSKCLTADPGQRPDTVQLGALLSGMLMKHIDGLTLSKDTLQKKLDKEKQKTVRHYHKAVWSERRYQQLLSSSSAPPPDHTPPLPLPRKGSSVCRQLSATFATAQAFSNAELAAAPTQTDPLQCSSDSVFLDNVSHDRLLGNWEQPAASPQVSVRGNGRPNPLISHTAKHSSSSGEVQQLSRKTSVTAHAPHPLEWWAGPYSPLAPGHKSRTPSASSTLSISPKHLREISDPILVLLTQLHKLLFLTQLPPNPTPSARWTLLQFYKRCLFKHGSSSRQLKIELHKMVNGSVEGVAWLEEEGEGFGGGARIVQCALQEMEEQMGYDDETCTLTYEMLHRIIESLAAEHGYQDTPTGHTHLSEPSS